MEEEEEEFNKRLLDRDEVFEEKCFVGLITRIAADICIKYLFIMSKMIITLSVFH